MLIYGYADRTNSGHQSYKFDSNGYGPAVVFNNVMDNVGRMYNPELGRFTAPVHGVYSFTISVFVDNGETQNTELWYNYNGERQVTFAALMNTNHPIITGSMHVVIDKYDYIDFRIYSYKFRSSETSIRASFYHTFVKWTLINEIP